ncbi:MAG: DedA family protein, partial [Gammaproteobacteria bacterium]
TGPRSRFRPWLLILLIGLAAVATTMLGLRTYRTFTLLSSAYDVGVPEVSTVRPWMTLEYVATVYRAPESAMREHLGLTAQTHSDITLKALAQRIGVSPQDYVKRVQRAIVSVAAVRDGAAAHETAGESEEVGEDVISAILVYGYPALALTLLLGALGLPLPSGLSLIVAGSLAAQGKMSWLVVAAVAIPATVAGDLAGYSVGRVLGRSFLDRGGHWFGLTPPRRARVERLFERWGGLTVLLSRTLVSVLSSAVNLIAGAGRYRFGAFVIFGIIGRMLWTSAYLGLGYIVSGEFDPAADFLTSLTGFLVSFGLLVALGVALRRSRVREKNLV